MALCDNKIMSSIIYLYVPVVCLAAAEIDV